MNKALFPPQKITLDKSQSRLNIVWRNGESSDISGAELRQFCACSSCRARQVVGARLITDETALDRVSLLGPHAMQAVFIDGHQRGIYPWAYLHAIAQGQAQSYFNE